MSRKKSVMRDIGREKLRNLQEDDSEYSATGPLAQKESMAINAGRIGGQRLAYMGPIRR